VAARASPAPAPDSEAVVAVAAAAGSAVAAVVAAVAAVAAAEAAAVVAAAADGDVKEDGTMRTYMGILALIALLPLRAAADETTFASPEAAVKAFIEAAGKSDTAALVAILGPDSEDVVSSGDPVADRNARERVVSSAKQKTKLEKLPSGAVVAHFGIDGWPLPIPLVESGGKWHFDTPKGKDEILNRRIGRNELKAIDVSLDYVDAQREHARREQDFAQKLRSDPGKHDGLYWEDPTGKNPSPFGPFLAEAAAEGYATPEAGEGPRPYHGYYFRILKAQGAAAPGGAKDWVKDGRMTGGFGLLAYPADHGNSGIMTFIVGPQGVVYEKDLGAQTADAAKAITTFDPDDSWNAARDAP
jgi:hypothetical protein